MRALILGAKGNLGTQLVKIFAAAGARDFAAAEKHDVIAWDREEIDITDRESVEKKVCEIKPDVIINAAAYNAVDRCEPSFVHPLARSWTTEDKEDVSEFELAKKLNGEAVGYLADAAMGIDALLVHYSTDYVFRKDINGTNREQIERIKKQGGYREDDEPNPVNKYGETKLMGEQELIKRSGQGLKWYLIRTSKLFGPKGASESVPPSSSPSPCSSRRVGASEGAGLQWTSKPSFFDLMLELAEEKGFRRRATNSAHPNGGDHANEDGIDVVDEELSCFTYTPDLAKATKELIENKKPYGIYHLVNSGPCTWYEAAKILFALAGMKVKVNPVAGDQFPRPAKRPKYSVLLNTKLTPLRDWREALKEYLKSK